MPVKVWIQAARLRTLPLALAGAVTGNLLAFTERGSLNPVIITLSILTAVFLQVLSNFANDYGDFKNGADTSERIDRVMASGAITEQKMKTAIGVLVALCLITGISLLIASLGIGSTRFWILLALGITGILAAYFYTAGKRPYGYAGLGDISVFIFFGLLSVVGTYFLQTLSTRSPIWFVATAIGLMSVGVLNINNIRDIASDESKHKITIAVRLGKNGAMVYQAVLLVAAMSCLIVYEYKMGTSLYYANIAIFIILLARHLRILGKAGQREDYNKQLKFLSLFTFFISIYFCSLEIALH